jgi:hypothetical protein
LVRKATPFDGEAVVRLRRVLRQEDGGSVHGPADPAPTLQEEISRIGAQEREPGQLVLVAELQERIVGWLELTPGASSSSLVKSRFWSGISMTCVPEMSVCCVGVSCTTLVSLDTVTTSLTLPVSSATFKGRRSAAFRVTPDSTCFLKPACSTVTV